MPNKSDFLYSSFFNLQYTSSTRWKLGTLRKNFTNTFKVRGAAPSKLPKIKLRFYLNKDYTTPSHSHEKSGYDLLIHFRKEEHNSLVSWWFWNICWAKRIHSKHVLRGNENRRQTWMLLWRCIRKIKKWKQKAPLCHKEDENGKALLSKQHQPIFQEDLQSA